MPRKKRSEATASSKNEQPQESVETMETQTTSRQSEYGSAYSEIPPSRFRPQTQSPGFKFFVIGLLATLLLVPALLVWGLVEERASRSDSVAVDIAKGWGASQVINGPYLVVPYKASVSNAQGKETSQIRYAIFSPAELNFKGDIAAQKRKKSIYSTNLYHINGDFSGNFEKPDLSKIGGEPMLEQAKLVIGVSDVIGFRSNVTAEISGLGKRQFKPGFGVGLRRSAATAEDYVRSATDDYTSVEKAGPFGGGIHLDMPRTALQSGFTYKISLALNGSRKLAVVPSGKSSVVALTSNWPHPGFEGSMLPETREISSQGFNANWTITELARGIDEVHFSQTLPGAASAVVVNFVEPMKFYQLVSRTLKYAIAFFALIFLAVFILELKGAKAIHWIQYILVGLAMVVFYILLLALAEHVGFMIAYFAAAAATTALVSWYVGNSLGQSNGSLIIAAVLATAYLMVFLVLQEEEYALLAGAIIAFLAIAATMYVTRDVDWSARIGENPKTS